MSDSEPQNSHQPPQAPSIANQLDSLADEIDSLTRPHDMPPGQIIGLSLQKALF